jgi:DNA-binding NarL/FixJ family response regulator
MNSVQQAAPHEHTALEPGVWFFSGDLIFAGRVRGAAETAGMKFSLLSKWPEAAPSKPHWIIVDLATKSGASAEICKLAKEHFPGVPCLAFGPHVQAARLSQARQNGFDPVMTRGQFDGALSSIFLAS